MCPLEGEGKGHNIKRDYTLPASPALWGWSFTLERRASKVGSPFVGVSTRIYCYGITRACCNRCGSKVLQENHPCGPGLIFIKISIFSHLLSYRTTQLDSTEVDLLARSGSVADSLRNDFATPPGKPSSIKAQRLVRLTCKTPPLKRERCTSKMELRLIISMTVIIRVKRSSRCSTTCMVHREDAAGRPAWTTACPSN